MKVREYDFLKALMRSLGIDVTVYHEPYTDDFAFDKGLREHLYRDYSYRDILLEMDAGCREKGLYPFRDSFGASYVIFGGVMWEGQRVLILAGPYLDERWRTDVEDVVRMNHLEAYHIPALQDYYARLARVENVEAVLLPVFSYFQGQDMRICPLQLNFRETQEALDLKIEEEDDSLTARMVEERYRYEDELTGAVEQGNLERIISLQKELKKYRSPDRYEDDIRNDKNMVLTLNVLYRKAVQAARVHPYYIDAVSERFVKQIENCPSRGRLEETALKMAEEYCHLVREYSLKGYSEMIGRAINYMDFHFREPLSVGGIAAEFSVSPGYLSTQFKKETGKTIVTWLNERRVERAAHLLGTTKIPVHEAAARVGIYDENYFARLFKKVKGVTPRDYRRASEKKKTEAL